MTQSRATDDEFIPSLAKGLAVIQLFSAKAPEWTLSQIARELELTPGSTRRILRTLELLGYAVATDGRFRLTSRVLNLGFAYLASQPFVTTAGPLLQALATRLGATCSIVTLDEREVVYLARATHRQFEPFYVHVGARLPAYATAPGKVLLAALSSANLERRLKGWTLEPFTPNTVTTLATLRTQITEARARGWAVNEQELFLGQRSIAVPLSIGATQTASLVAAAPVAKVTQAELETGLLPALQAAAEEMRQIAAAFI